MRALAVEDDPRIAQDLERFLGSDAAIPRQRACRWGGPVFQIAGAAESAASGRAVRRHSADAIWLTG